jgi:hypothetical protein
VGAYDVPLLIGAAAIAGYFILTNPDILAGIFPSAGAGGTFEPGTDDSSTPTASSSGSPCGDLCRAKDCSGYKKQCTTGCVHCPNSGPNSPGGGGGSSGGNVSRPYNECQSKFGGGCNVECGGDCTGKCKDCHNACGGKCSSASEVTTRPGAGKGGQNVGSQSCAAQASGNCGGDCKKTCWHGKAANGSIFDTCVDQKYSTGSCANARNKFCAAHGPCTGSNMAYARYGRTTAHQMAYYASQNNWTNNGISIS